MSSERRWWTLPKMFSLPLWHSSSSAGSANTLGHVETNHKAVEGAPAREKAAEGASSEDEDLEEFLEKQRDVRLGQVEVLMPSPAKSNRKYLSSDEKFRRSKSLRRSSRSSSKSSGSTKYSSFSRTSDTENDKAIKETIYETGASQISFSFFNDNEKSASESENQQLYDNITEDAKAEAPILESAKNQESSPQIVNQGNIELPPCGSKESSVPAELCEEISMDDHSPEIQTDAGSKERHITKLTILLSSVRPVRTEEMPSSAVQLRSASPEETDGKLPPPLDDQELPSRTETDKPLLAEEDAPTPVVGPEKSNVSKDAAEDISALYSVIDKCPRTSLSSSIVDSVDYAELGEFQQPLPSPDQAEVPNMEYCAHRAGVKTRLRKISLKRKRKPQPSLKRMNLQLNRAWRSLRGWWYEEKSKLSQLRGRSASKDEEARDSAGGSRDGSAPSDKSFYEALKECGSLEEAEEEADGGVDEDGYCSLEPQRRRYSSVDGGNRADVMLRRKSCISELSAVRRYPPHPPPRTAGVNAFRKSKYFPPQGQDGFEDLRRYIKQGGDLCKELSIILQERSEAELQYAKTLSKLSNKLLKVSKEAVGTVSQAWHKAGIELESTSEIHKTFATALCEEVVKPLKQLLESQHRIRKSVENAVDKTGKNLSEWRTAESKSKKQSFVSARENEKLQDITLDVRLSGGLTGSNKLTASSLHLHQKHGSEKESSKLETKRKKAEELVKKSDVEYYTYCLRAERARLEWETAVVRGSQCFQALEEERLQQLKHLAFVYWQHCRDIGPKLTQSAVRLKEPIESCDVSTDIKTIASTKGVEQPISEQLLPDFYAEHTTLAMNRERRRQALIKVLQLVVQDLERERRGKNGVENLARAFKQSPNFGNVDSQQNVSEKLHHMRFMLTYLEAARYKLSSALAELDGKPKPSHPLASHIHVIRDRQGFQQSILKVPPWVHKETIECSENAESPEWTDRGTADGNSVQPDSDFDEFSSQGSSEKDFESNMFTVMPDSVVSTPSPAVTGKCRALYQYTANLYDELNLEPGDVINIHDKQPDGWWLGELNGVVGIFPATYVEEIS